MCFVGVSARAAVSALAIGLLMALLASPAASATDGAERSGQVGAASAKKKGKKAKGKKRARGKLVLRIGGLPRGERGTVVLTGPPRSDGKQRLKRRISRLGKVRIGGLKPGRYRLLVNKAKMRRGHGKIKRGATAFPGRKRIRVRVGRRKAARVNVRYRTIRNPGVRTLRAKVLRVVGHPRRPRALVVRGRQRYRRGDIVSSRPAPKLPRGLLSRVTGVRREGRVSRIALRSASIYEVAPNMSFRTRLRARDTASASLGLSCEGGSGITPFVRITNIWTDGGWTTSSVWPFGDVTTGARVDLSFDVAAGVDIASLLGGSCELSLPGLTLQGFAAGIPIYGSIKPVLGGTVGVGARLKAEGKVRVNAGARISAIPPRAEPSVSFGSPQFTFSDEVFADLGVGFGIRSEIGLGVESAANIHAAFGNNLDFGIGSGACRWDLRLGSFSAGGKLGRWGISTPSTPPLYTQNLWSAPCAPPPLPVPLARARASWLTDADVDLYAWDEAGNEAYFGDRDAVPGAELVEDVIPAEGETIHEAELSIEHSPLGRRLTFGLCLYRGEPTNVTLNVPFVPDPRGPEGVYEVPLGFEGDGRIVATSPAGVGYVPPDGWCRSVAE